MAHRRLLVVLVGIGLLLLAAGCANLANAPTPQDDQPVLGGVDLNDPEVGGGIGFPDEEAPLPTPLPDTSPRLSGTAAPATEVAPVATAEELPSPTAAPPSPTATAVPPVAEETVEEITAGGAEDETAQTDEPAPAEDEAPQEAGAEDESAPAVEPEGPRTHIVAPGENLFRIGLQYGVSWQALAAFNGLTDADQITAGQELLIPPAEETEDGTPAPDEAEATEESEDGDESAEAPPTPPAQPEEPTPSPLTETTHVVRPGDSVYRLSQLYGVSWVQIAEANGLITPNQIFIGQVLKIPVSLPGPTPEFVHNVRSGESLFRIALQYGVPLAALAEANGLQEPYVIYPGQTLVIPGLSEPAP